MTIPHFVYFSPKEENILDMEIQKLLDKKVIENDFFSTIFPERNTIEIDIEINY